MLNALLTIIALSTGLASMASAQVLELAGVDRDKSVEKVVILSLNPYIGDELIQMAPKILHFHRVYGPKTTIHVLSPNAHLYQETAWLKPQTLDVRQIFSPAQVEYYMATRWTPGSQARMVRDAAEGFERYVVPKLRRHLGATTLLYFNARSMHVGLHRLALENGADPAKLKERYSGANTRVITRLRALSKDFKTILLYKGKDFYNLLGRAGTHLKTKAMPSALYELYQRHSYVWESIWAGVYSRAQEGLFDIFGKAAVAEDYLSFGHLLKSPAKAAELRAFIEGAGLDAKKGFIVFNFNGSIDKAASFKDSLVVHQAVVEHFGKSHPDVNLLIVPPEGLPETFADAHRLFKDSARREELARLRSTNPETYARLDRMRELFEVHESNRQAIRDLVSASSSTAHGVALLPERDYAIINRAIQDAQLFLSRDTGMVHIAYLLRNIHELSQAERARSGVVTFSMSGASDSASRWTAPGVPVETEVKPTAESLRELLALADKSYAERRSAFRGLRCLVRALDLAH